MRELCLKILDKWYGFMAIICRNDKKLHFTKRRYEISGEMLLELDRQVTNSVAELMIAVKLDDEYDFDEELDNIKRDYGCDSYAYRFAVLFTEEIRNK